MRPTTLLSCALIVSIVLLAILAPGSALADSRYQPIMASGEVFGAPETGYAGEAEVRIGKEVYDATVRTFITGAPVVDPDGTMHAPTMHIFTIGSRTFVTNDKATLHPTPAIGVYRVLSHMQVVQGGTGHMIAHGTADMIAGTITWRLSGVIDVDD